MVSLKPFNFHFLKKGGVAHGKEEEGSKEKEEEIESLNRIVVIKNPLIL